VADPAETQRLAEEERLVAEAQAGNTESLRVLLAGHADTLYAAVILPRLGGSAAAAEDVLRDTFAAAIEKIGSFRWEGRGVHGWLRQIALNKIVDVHRRAQRTGRVLRELAEEPRAGTPAADEALIAEEERRRARVRIDAALARLPDRYRAALRLRLVDEQPREACARALGVTVATFDVVFYRAVRAFRRQYDDGGAGAP
jgi:RNA polymerase sigma-70 factor (ECF subfamily)